MNLGFADIIGSDPEPLLSIPEVVHGQQVQVGHKEPLNTSEREEEGANGLFPALLNRV